MANYDTVQSVTRALHILECVAANVDGVPLDEVARQCGLNKTTAHNLLRTLRMRGYVEQGAGRRFFMGGAVQELWLRRERHDIFLRAETVMALLHRRMPHATLTFCELVGSEIACRMRMAEDCPGVLRRPRAHTLNPYTSASGLCLQARNVNFREHLVSTRPFDESSQHIWASFAEFEAARAAAARQGLAELCVASRIRLAAPVGDVFTIGLQHLLDDMVDPDALRQAVREAARDIGASHPLEANPKKEPT